MRIGRRARQGDNPGRSLRHSDSERIEAIAHDAAVPVEEVLRDVAEFRLALETDMIVAAAAADEAPELLSEIVDGERAELADFHDRLLERLVDAAVHDELALRRARRSSAARGRRVAKTVAAAAAVLAIFGVTRVPGGEDSDNRLALATATQQYADLSTAVSSDHSTAALNEAAAELHETLESLITQHAGDPQVAQHAAALLRAEISLLQDQDPAGASQVIAQAKSLMTLLRQAAPPNIRASVAPILDSVTTSPSPKPTATPTPKATPTPSPKPTPKATATAKPSASASENSDSPLP